LVFLKEAEADFLLTEAHLDISALKLASGKSADQKSETRRQHADVDKNSLIFCHH
jgi:hypothetical protein